MSGLFAIMVSAAKIRLPSRAFEPDRGGCCVMSFCWKVFIIAYGKKFSEEFQMCTFLIHLSATIVLCPLKIDSGHPMYSHEPIQRFGVQKFSSIVMKEYKPFSYIPHAMIILPDGVKANRQVHRDEKFFCKRFKV